jgi:hypothetical protein
MRLHAAVFAVLLLTFLVLANRKLELFYLIIALVGALLMVVVDFALLAYRWLGAPLLARGMCSREPQLLWPRTLTVRPEGLETADRGDRVVLPWVLFGAMHPCREHLFFELVVRQV